MQTANSPGGTNHTLVETAKESVTIVEHELFKGVQFGISTDEVKNNAVSAQFRVNTQRPAVGKKRMPEHDVAGPYAQRLAIRLALPLKRLEIFGPRATEFRNERRFGLSRIDTTKYRHF
jgi:hypothetical protein